MPLRLAFIQFGPLRAEWFTRLSRFLGPDIETSFYTLEPDARSILQRLGIAAAPRTIPGDILLLGNLLSAPEWRAESSVPSAWMNARSAWIRSSIESHLKEQQVDAIAVWGAWGAMSRMAISIANRERRAIIFFDEGPEPGTMQIDSEGVNYDSSFRRSAGRMLSGGGVTISSVTQRQPAVASGSGAGGSTVRSPRKLTPASFLSRVPRAVHRILRPRQVWRGLVARLAGIPESRELPERFILVPLQVTNDPQLVKQSPLIRGDLNRLVDLAWSAIEDMPGMALVIKLHPGELRAVNRSHAQHLRHRPGVFVKLHTSVDSLLEACSAVITINSTVGYQAIAAGKPVIALGRSYYSLPEIVSPVPDVSAVPAILRSALANSGSDVLRRAFLESARQRFMTPGHWRNYDDASFAAVARRVRWLVQRWSTDQIEAGP